MSILDSGGEDLSQWSVESSCYWLLEMLQVRKHNAHPYTIPLCNYVLTWPKAIPLNAIVIGQNPYPNNIFCETAAAMSYDRELTSLCANIKGDIPPTVQILSNDLYINAGMKKEDTVALIKDGWALAEKGILLVNNCVYSDWQTVEGYRESVNQTAVLLRLLQETEKFGPLTVKIYVLGDAAQRMAGNIQSWYKSKSIKLSKKSVTHPAALSRRFENLYDPACHMSDASFSKSLAGLLRNHVAFVHTMSTKKPPNRALVRQTDALRALQKELPEYARLLQLCEQASTELGTMDYQNAQEVAAAATKFSGAVGAAASRTLVLAAIIENATSTTQAAAGIVSKSGPHTPTVAPSSIPDIPVSRTSSKPVVFRKSGPASSNTNPVSTASIGSVETKVAPATISFRRKPATSTSTTVEKVTPSQSSNQSKTNDLEEKAETLKVQAAKLGTPIKFRRSSQATERSASAASRNREPVTPSKTSVVSGTSKGPLAMERVYVNQLSSVRSIAEILKPGFEEDETVCNAVELIDHDVGEKVAYNSITQELCKALAVDIERNRKFDLGENAMDAKEVPGESTKLLREYLEIE